MQEPLIDQAPQMAAVVPAEPVVIGEPPADSPAYVVPTPASGPSVVNAARLTNYVVAHSEYSSPLGRRSVLSGIVAEGAGSPDTAAQSNEPQDAGATPADATVEQK
jgi:hypothetical protein